MTNNFKRVIIVTMKGGSKMNITKTLYFTSVFYRRDNQEDCRTFAGKLNIVKATKVLAKELGSSDFYITDLEVFKEVYACGIYDFMSVAKKI